jgi:hypothetical protein
VFIALSIASLFSCASVSQQDVQDHLKRTNDVIATIAQDVLPQLSIAFAANPQWTADERRTFARGVVKTEIEAKWPDYAFLLDTIVEIVVAQKK